MSDTTPKESLIAEQVAAMQDVDGSISVTEAHAILREMAPYVTDGKLFYAVRPATRAIVKSFDRLSPRQQVTMMARVRPLITAAKDAAIAYRIRTEESPR